MEYKNYYKHCGIEWDDVADSKCNDKCCKCGKEIEPYESNEVKQYKIPCSWEVYSYAYVNAESMDKAIAIAEQDEFPLPTDTNYVDGSFEVDLDVCEELNKRRFNHGK